YAELMRRAMYAKNMSRRDLEKKTNYSYEHIRKVLRGLPLMSEQFNIDICKELDLNPDETWQLALREKFQSKGLAVTLPGDPRLKAAWADLPNVERESIIKIAEGMAEAWRATRQHNEMDNPDQTRALILELTSRLETRTQKDPAAAG